MELSLDYMPTQEKNECWLPRVRSSSIYVARWNTWSAFEKTNLMLKKNGFNYYGTASFDSQQDIAS